MILMDLDEDNATVGPNCKVCGRPGGGIIGCCDESDYYRDND